MNPLEGKILKQIPIIDDKVVFSVLEREPRNLGNFFYFSVDNIEEFHYVPFYLDFGPPSVAQLIEFARYAEGLLHKHKKQMLHFYTGPQPQMRSNAFCYILVFRMFHLRLNPHQTIAPYKYILHRFLTFRDASPLPQTFDMTHEDVLNGVFKGVAMKWLNINEFDIDEYDRLKKVDEGNMNWIIPHKLIACATPYSHSPIQYGIEVVTPETVIPKFKALGVTHVIRLNQQFYDANILKEAGFKHTELYFDDGSVPPMDIVEKFLYLCENEDGIIALHCKAGLGRTGTLIACLLIRKYGFTPREAIAWIRVCRPGSIVGPQQEFVLNFDQPKVEKKKKKRPIRPPETPRPKTGRFNPSKGFYLGDSFIDLYENKPKPSRHNFGIRTGKCPMTPRAEIKRPFGKNFAKTAPSTPRKTSGSFVSTIVLE